MNTRFTGLACLALALAACTSQKTAPQPGVLGLLEVRFEGIGSASISASAQMVRLQAGVGSQAATVVPVNGTPALGDVQLLRRLVSFDDDDVANKRFVRATFEVINRSTLNFANLTLYAVNIPTNLGGTGVVRMTDAAGNPITDSTIAQGFKPTHGMRPAGSSLEVNPAQADLQFFTSDEINFPATGVKQQAIALGIVNPSASVLDYGFVAQNLSGGRAIASPNTGAPSNCTTNACKGTITLAYSLPKVSPRSANPFAFSLYFVVANQTTTRVSRSVEESTAQVTARATAVGATEAVLVGSDTDTVPGVTTIRLPDVHIGTAPTFLLGTGACGGFARASLTTPPGYCVGIVASGLSTPRGILPLANGEILITEFSGGGSGNGSITRLIPGTPSYTVQRPITNLVLPHGLAFGPDGKIYVGEDHRVFRLSPSNLSGPEYVVTDLPAGGSHTLSSLMFDLSGNLYVNVGGPSDNCQSDINPGTGLCNHASNGGLIRKYPYNSISNSFGSFEIFATGLRNSVALTRHSSGTLMQGENSRDFPEEDRPNDELNVLQQGVNYGWPYCYHDVAVSPNPLVSPEFPSYNCAATQSATVKLPAHSAPLGLAYWNNPEVAYNGHLVVTLHGFRQYGHRLVAFPVNAQGIPNGAMVDLITGWGIPLGGPVDVKVGLDGALYITDDRRNQVVMFRKEF